MAPTRSAVWLRPGVGVALSSNERDHRRLECSSESDSCVFHLHSRADGAWDCIARRLEPRHPIQVVAKRSREEASGLRGSAMVSRNARAESRDRTEKSPRRLANRKTRMNEPTKTNLSADPIPVDQNLGSLFQKQVAERRDAPAVYFVVDGETQQRSWSELGDDVFRWTDVLSALGVHSQDRIAHWSGNRYEWIATDFALHCLGAVHVPLHSTLSARQAVDQLVHSEPKLVILSGDEQLLAVAKLADELPDSLLWVCYDSIRLGRKSQRNGLLRLGEIVDLPSKMEQADAARGKQLAAETTTSVDPHDVATILYSSGTTGEPKGIMLSQANLWFNAQQMADVFAGEPLERRLNFLPLSHIFGRTCDLYTWLVRGAELALTQSRETIMDDCKRFEPDVINGVPFFFERVRQKLEEKGLANEPGVLSKALGGRVRGCFSGGGALADHTYEYYLSQGVPLMQGYGMTEASPVISFSTLETHKRGCSGMPLEGIDVRIADDGEILTRGPHVMLGYWKDNEATANTVRNGWLHTGDLGVWEESGLLRITGRKKELIVTSTGKNVLPSHIEDLLCRDPLILQAVVIGDGRNCLSALVVPDPDVLRSEIRKRRIWAFRRKSAVKHRRVRALYRDRIQHQLRDVSKHEKVQVFTILDRGFTPESGHMTAKLSLRRDLIERDFSDVIDKMYADDERLN